MWRIIKTAAIVVLALFTLFIVYEVFTFPHVSELRTKNPETTSMIEQRQKEAREEGREPRRVQQWVPLERISVNLQRAVLAGEDTNFVAWGDCVYGAAAAAQTYFHKHASDLSAAEAAYLSAMIPSPLNVFNPQKNPRRIQRRQRVILRGMNSVKLPAC